MMIKRSGRARAARPCTTIDRPATRMHDGRPVAAIVLHADDQDAELTVTTLDEAERARVGRARHAQIFKLAVALNANTLHGGGTVTQREVRIGEETVSAIDFMSRLLGAGRTWRTATGTTRARSCTSSAARWRPSTTRSPGRTSPGCRGAGGRVLAKESRHCRIGPRAWPAVPAERWMAVTCEPPRPADHGRRARPPVDLDLPIGSWSLSTTSRRRTWTARSPGIPGQPQIALPNVNAWADALNAKPELHTGPPARGASWAVRGTYPGCRRPRVDRA